MTKQVVPQIIRASNHPFQPDFINYNIFDLDNLDSGPVRSEEVCSNVTTVPATITFAEVEALCIADATAKSYLP